MEFAKERHQESFFDWYQIKDADVYSIPEGDFQPSSLKVFVNVDGVSETVRFELGGVFTGTGEFATRQWYSNKDTPEWLRSLVDQILNAPLGILGDDELQRRIDEIKELIRISPFRTARARDEFRHLGWAFDGTGRSPQAQASIICRWTLPDLDEVHQYDVIRSKAKNIFFPSAD